MGKNIMNRFEVFYFHFFFLLKGRIETTICDIEREREREKGNLHLKCPASWIRAPSVTCDNAAGADDAAAAANACGSENVRTKASMCFKAILLAPSKLTLFEVLSDEVPTRAYSSILQKVQQKIELIYMQVNEVGLLCKMKG